MKIAYLLADTEVSGGIRVAVAHGDALIDRGHQVTMVTLGRPLTWRRSRAAWRHVSSWSDFDAAPFDVVIGTFWTTVAAAYQMAGPRAVHFCQGYEGSFAAYGAIKLQIDAVYRLPVPKMTITPTLAALCRQFTDDVTCVGQIVDDEFFQPRASHSGPPRVLVSGPAQADMKGIDVAYDAVRLARERGAAFDLIRVSPWMAADDEPTELAAEFHVGIDTTAMARLLASCDAIVAPNRRQEGFGLPAAEAMASGVPAVLSEIPSFLWWDAARDHALFAPEGDARATADALVRLLNDAALRKRLAARGREVVEQFRAEKTGARLEELMERRRVAGRAAGGSPEDR